MPTQESQETPKPLTKQDLGVIRRRVEDMIAAFQGIRPTKLPTGLRDYLSLLSHVAALEAKLSRRSPVSSPADPTRDLKKLASEVLDELHALSMHESSADPATASRALAEAVLRGSSTAPTPDTARLDWLAQCAHDIYVAEADMDEPLQYHSYRHDAEDRGTVLRAAIDASMQGSPSTQPTPNDGVSLIAAERERQVSAEGWTAEHDDEHDGGEIAGAASSYAAIACRQVAEGIRDVSGFPPGQLWRWESRWWKPSNDPIRNLVKAGALIAAEIDRLQRAKSQSGHPAQETTPEPINDPNHLAEAGICAGCGGIFGDECPTCTPNVEPPTPATTEN